MPPSSAKKVTGPKPAKERKRQWAPKSRRGCLTCKIRRVKCDEAKPSCERCSSTGRTCEYGTEPTQNQRIITHDRFRFIAHPLSINLIPGLRLDTAEERASLSFFEQHASLELCGPFNSKFWQRQLLQAAQIHPVIRYSVVALGAMYRKLASGTASNVPDDPTDNQIRFALQQSNRAIQELVKPARAASPADKITILTSCVLFHSMACIQGLQMNALSHLRSGLKLLQEIDEQYPNIQEMARDQPITIDCLRSIMVSFDVQARTQMSVPDLLDWELPPGHGQYHTYADSYTAICQAQVYLEALLNHILCYLQSLYKPEKWNPTTIMTTLSLFKEQIMFGRTMVDDIEAQLYAENDTAQRRAFIALRMLQTTAEVFINIVERRTRIAQACNDMSDRHSASDEPFYRLFDLASELLELTATPRQVDGCPSVRPVFSAGYGSVAALWMVSVRAKSFNLRRKAINMLLNNPRREGLWDAPSVGQIAKAILEFEETSAREELGIMPSELDEAHSQELEYLRCADIVVRYDGPRQAVTDIRNLRQVLRNERGIQTTCRW
ncbi:hypothetical protein BU24DRAFT_405778 [Aaosphaeria arxii CBS 175.79]|uniref:Zn(2)-C6 fungal-type domain-containing protein n=1 Tax=Aaosphaeria arxii CBS 175.79 TaxID=1450172 RepID=A0A6A5Y3A1_9PLEO|nr:uncharacterized protein BU24DRAFT_405778 [Aaosphaeria arxii CBS 175.79]KAF2019064.1 hypothetical protein BU24DRAFT_405778 [Aaosphaeria arxii CBS 175.79]